MESESNLAGSKFAPRWRLKLEWQTDHVFVELDRAIHICNEFDYVAQLGCHWNTSEMSSWKHRNSTASSFVRSMSSPFSGYYARTSTITWRVAGLSELSSEHATQECF